MNEQQIEAVERLVKAGVFPNGIISVIPGLNTDCCKAFIFRPTCLGVRSSRLEDVFHALTKDPEGDDGEDWKRAGVK